MATETTTAKQPRKTPAPPMTKDDVKYIVENIPTMSYTDIATERGITRNQVNRVRTEVVNELRRLVKEVDPSKNDKAEEYINTKLSRPEEMKVGGNKGAGQAKKAIDNVVGSILDSL